MSFSDGAPEHRKPGDSEEQIAAHRRDHLGNLPRDVARMGLSESYFEGKVGELAFGISEVTGEGIINVIRGVLPTWRVSGFSDLADAYAEALETEQDQGAMG